MFGARNTGQYGQAWLSFRAGVSMKPNQPKKAQSELEATLEFHMKAAGLLVPVCEYRFHPPRKWRFDFAWPFEKIAVECEGATWTQGRHVRGAGFEDDCIKYNQAALDGWTVRRFTSGMIKSGNALNQIESALQAVSLYKLGKNNGSGQAGSTNTGS